MKVFKFGGASVKDADAVRNMTHIVKDYANEPLVIVVSAMDKTTNALEEIVELTISRNSQKAIERLEKIKAFHVRIAKNLLGNDKKLESDINNIIVEVEWVIEDNPEKDKGLIYDLPHDWSDGAPGYTFEPLEALSKLNAVSFGCSQTKAFSLV